MYTEKRANIPTTVSAKDDLAEISKLRKLRGASNRFEYEIASELISNELTKEKKRHD